MLPFHFHGKCSNICCDVRKYCNIIYILFATKRHKDFEDPSKHVIFPKKVASTKILDIIFFSFFKKPLDELQKCTSLRILFAFISNMISESWHNVTNILARDVVVIALLYAKIIT